MTISRKDFIDDALSLTSGRYAMDIENAMGEMPEQPPEQEGVMVASISGSLPRVFRNLLNKDTRQVLGAARQPTAPEAAPIEDIRAVLADYEARKQSPEGPEADRLMSNLETSEDLGYMLEIMGSSHETVPRSWPEVEAQVGSRAQVEKELEPLLQGTQSGLLNDAQMLGLRRMLVTLGEETTVLANKVVAGDATPETMALYQQKFRQMESLYKYSRGQATEIARALNQQKILAKSLGSGSLQDLVSANNAFGTNDEIAQHAQLFLNKKNKGGMGKAIEHMSDKANSITKAALEYWKNNILSGVETHAVNVSSTALTNVWETVVIRPTAATIGAVRGGITGSKDRVYYSEQLGALAGSWVGLRSGVRMMADVLKTGDSQFGMAKDEAHGEIHKLLGNKVGNAATMSFRLLRAEDELAKSVAFTQQIYALATRDGLMKGLSGDELNNHVAKFIDEPPKAAYEDAMSYAQHLTFTQDEVGGVVGSMAKMAKGLVGNYPIFGFIMPFINTPANLLNYAMETSFLAPLAPSVWNGLKKGGAQADVALAKITTGTALSATVYQLYAQGVLTGDGPGDYETRKYLEQSTGWKQQGVKIGDTWYSLDRTDPFAQSMALVANYFDKATYAKNPKEAEEYTMRAIYTLSEVALDSTWLQSFADFVDFASGDRNATKYLTNFATGFVPYSGLVKSVEKGMDPETRVADIDKLSNNVKAYVENKFRSQIPGMSEYVRPARHWDGSIVVPSMGNLAYMASPIKTGVAKDPGPVDKEFIANGVTPREPDPIVTVGPVEFSLLSLDNGEGMFYDAYIKRVGEVRKAVMKQIVEDESYQAQNSGPGSFKSDILERGLASAQTAGLGLFLEEDVLPLMLEYPQLRNRVAEQIGADPVEFFQQMVDDGLMGKDLPIDAIIRGRPIRSPIPLPGGRPPRSAEEIMPRF